MAPSKREAQQRKAQPADASGPWAHPPSDVRRIITLRPMLLIQQDPGRWSSISTDCKDIPRWRGGGALEEALSASSILPLSLRRPTVAHRAVFSIAQSIVRLWWDLRKVGILCVVCCVSPPPSPMLFGSLKEGRSILCALWWLIYKPTQLPRKREGGKSNLLSYLGR